MLVPTDFLPLLAHVLRTTTYLHFTVEQIDPEKLDNRGWGLNAIQ